MNCSSRRGLRSRVPFLAIVVALLGILTACGLFGGDDAQYGNQVVLEGQAFVVCSQECADRGQCGVAADGTEVVLIHNAAEPAVRNHNSFLPHATPVVIGETRSELLVQTFDNAEFALNFYSVTNQDLLRTGWVAGWCIADQVSSG